MTCNGFCNCCGKDCDPHMEYVRNKISARGLEVIKDEKTKKTVYVSYVDYIPAGETRVIEVDMEANQ